MAIIPPEAPSDAAPPSIPRKKPPYGILRGYFERGEIVPFLGAGASLGPRPPAAMFDGRSPKFLPTGGELSEWLAGLCEFPEKPASDLAKVASYFQIQSTREDLTSSLRKVFSPEYPPGAIHQLLAEAPKPLLIITTNYDDLIERAFRARSKPYHLVTYPEGDEYAGSVVCWKHGDDKPIVCPPADLSLKVEDVTIIYKMHGSIMKEAMRQWESFVITEEDYVRFLSRMTAKGGVIPAMLMLHLRRSALLFLGYGLRDWNLRVMLETLRRPAQPGREEVNRRPAWAIQRKPLPIEQSLWEYRDVKIFDEDLDTFAARMRE